MRSCSEDIKTGTREALGSRPAVCVWMTLNRFQRFHEAYQGPVDASYAAAVVGLETEAFLEKIRENIGLQNIGLLVLDSENGSMKRDAWTSSFNAMIYALDFPEAEVDSPSQPDLLPGGGVHIPDSNLRAAIAEELGKSPNAPITVQEMAKLERLEAQNSDIYDLTGLQFATNLSRLYLDNNEIADLSPLASLINLRELNINRSLVSDISPLRSLTNLTKLFIRRSQVSDLSPIAGLINLRSVSIRGNPIFDISPLRGLINLTELWIGYDTPVSDLSPVAGLINLKGLDVSRTNVSDLSPVAGLINLEWLWLDGNNIADISPLAGLTALERLGLASNDISDISRLAGLTNLTWLNLDNNELSDVSPILGLTNLTWLSVSRNNISDLSVLEELRRRITTVLWAGNPGIPEGGPKIEGPWLWVLLPGRKLESGGADLLSEASGGTVTELAIATNGATAGEPVGDEVWTSYRLPSEPQNNIGEMLGQDPANGSIYGIVSIYSPRAQETTLHVGADDEVKVWLNGVVVYKNFHIWGSGDYTDFAPVTLRAGKNILLVAVGLDGSIHNGKFGFKPGTEYTVSTGVGYTFSPTPIHFGDTFTFYIHAENVTDLAGWQFDIAFDPAALEAVDVSEGNFLKMGGTTFFQSGSIDNVAGKIIGLSAARLSAQGVTGTGPLLQVRFKAKSAGETEVALQKLQFGSVTGDTIAAGSYQFRITVEGRLTTGDVNRDGVVSILDLILVAQQLGRRVPAGSAVDVNGDGIVSILDLIRVAQGIAGSPAAPAAGTASIDAATIEAWIAQARLEDDGSLAFRQGIENLQALLRSLIPETSALLRNYPNPFNPETWIPYHLSTAADVKLTIYDSMGVMIRQFDLGYQSAGYYTDRTKAAYWDGRNAVGESVASGIYFYALTAGDFTNTRKLLIRK